MTQHEKWTDAFLDDMRCNGDPLADDAAAALFAAIQGRDKDEVAAFITKFVSHDFTHAWRTQTLIPDPPELLAYFERFDEFKLTPEELQYLEKGAQFFEKHGPWITFALGVRSLLKQYAHTKAIEVLRLTTLLVQHVNRRIMETMQFVLDVMEVGWDMKDEHGHDKLNLDHPGILSIKKLRLVHAMVRYRILHRMYDTSLGEYDDSILGHPINQEDMVFAVHTFSLEVIEGLREMRIAVSEEEAENYFHCWRIIGRALGVDPRLEPDSYKDAMALQEKIYARHFTLPNTAGPKLAKALTDWFVNSIPLVKEKTMVTVIKEFNGPENYKVLQEHLKIDIGDVHPDLHKHLEEDLDFQTSTARPTIHADGSREKVLDDFFLQFLQSLITVERGGKNERFRIGDGFMAAWNLNNMAEKPRTKLENVLFAIQMFIEKLLSWLRSNRDKSQPS